MPSNKFLVLIDIDGTLITPGMTPRHALRQAILDVTGQVFTFEVGQLAGLTDPLIVTDALRQLGIPSGDDGLPDRIIERYLEIFERDYPSATDKWVYPGAFDFLDYLKEQPVRMGIVTGNVRRGARIKLAPFDLWRYFDFGVFGDDDASRNELPRIALKKTREMFQENFEPDKVIVVGDTIYDIRCAHVNRMQSVIVLRRPEWRALIESEKPELLIESFEPLEPVRDWFNQIFLNHE